jgi:hypothetical protein
MYPSDSLYVNRASRWSPTSKMADREDASATAAEGTTTAPLRSVHARTASAFGGFSTTPDAAKVSYRYIRTLSVGICKQGV